MRVVLAASIALALASQSAHAQQRRTPSLPGPSDKEKAAAQDQRDYTKSTDDAYKATLQRIPDAKPVDPWGNLRAPAAPAGSAGSSSAK